MDFSWKPTRMNARTFSTNTATSHTAHDWMRSRAGISSGARRDAAIANTTVVIIPESFNCSARIQTKNAPQNWTITAVETSVIRTITMSDSRDSTSASTTLPAVTTSSIGITLHPDMNPVITAPTARR